ncbi:DUF370 domain-containing protein [Amygdalobacter nucleatus]|uniref:Regulatory protein n=1 Tax=Amygdalobacter nucleatus TaxID=3029274 RepID=A0A133Y7N8_9FIRM|nr:DUF370 domain-containing protein [Amygdalobacter nucleatus]KXB39211.1 hypothetical protein HMPREF1872_01243 [Amygdalobacter nucleatus]MDF0485461.1 DUF370 domain-containing protein [Amygdalobacter nucleatus]WEG36680.1 DUF370 domain-containing protein [Amygdalobacter nucleatus]
MSAEFINVAYDNFINKERVLLITASDSSPIKRLINEAKENGMLIDCSQGKKTKSVIFLDSDHIVLSALTPEALNQRLSKQTITEQNEKEAE